MDVTLDDLACLVGGTVSGDGRTVIRAVNGIKEAGPGDITFLANTKYAPLLATTKASAVVLAMGTTAPLPALSVQNPDLAFARVALHLSGGTQSPPPGVHPTAVVAATARLGNNVSIGAGTVVEDGASIGDGSVLYAQVYVGRETEIGPDALIYPQVVIREKCRIGARVILQSGAVIGSDGFGYATDAGVHHKIPQVGIVVIEDDVELGANVTVDRARFGRTVIGKGTKIDNLVQIGHNVVLGRGCLLVSQAGIAGSTRLGDYVVMAGQSGLIGHLDIGDGAIITAQSGLTKDVPTKAVMSGSPASDRRTHLKELAALSKLPEALQEIRKLRQELDLLREKVEGMKKTQRTIQKPAELEGVGLFTGSGAKVRIQPAPANSGITFVRSDLPNRPRLPVTPDTVSSKFRRSAVLGENVEIETIEHLMSALGGLEIDNLEVEVNASELPNLDGSSRPWVELLRGAGISELPDPKKIDVVREPITVTDNEAQIVALPNEGGLTVSYTLNYPNTPIGQQHYTLEVSEESYSKLISPARTFCLQSEAEAFIQQGLGKGATYQSTVVWGPDGPIENTLRFPDEPVRHKILDLMGDLATLGAGLRAHVFANKSGHNTNMRLVKKIAASFNEAGQLQAKPGGTLLDVREIAKILPHRFPFLLIDKVIELDGYRRAVGIKNVSYNEPFFQGHFPDQPIMPGVLQIEAMAQLAGVLLMRKSENQAKVAVLLSLDGVKLRKSVVPGDQLRLEVETIRVKARTGEVFARATVDGQLVAEANMKFMLMDGQ